MSLYREKVAFFKILRRKFRCAAPGDNIEKVGRVFVVHLIVAGDRNSERGYADVVLCGFKLGCFHHSACHYCKIQHNSLLLIFVIQGTP